jgi:signal transduction histidine kinase
MGTAIPMPENSSSIMAPESLPVEVLHKAKILIIDDEQANVRLLERILRQMQFSRLASTTDSRTAVALFMEFQPDLVLTDWLMPHLDGFALIEQLRASIGSDEYLPIVVLTADVSQQARQRALAAGATDFLTKPFDHLEVLLRIGNLLQARLSYLQIEEQKGALEESVRNRTIDLEQALTELKTTQQQVIQQERLAALGTMAGGIAHDFNNALSIIMGYGELLLRDAAHGLTRENATLPLTTILTAAEDAAKIVHRLRIFYRPDEIEEPRAPVDLNLLIDQAILLTQPRWQAEATASGRTITIATEPGEIPCIAGNAAELREVLTNLIFNAVDALPQGGVITLGTRCEGEAVFLKISDTGTGMREEVRQRCLEPFFTTKGKSGTGLGLSMVFGIIQRHGGTIDIASELGQGTTFTLRLPPATDESATGRGASPFSTGPLRVLVVDDQPILSQLVREYLQDDHHLVETAISGSDALEKFRTGHFDLVITDQAMDEMSGEQLAVTIKELDPKIPVILLTGYAGDSTAGKRYSEAIDFVLAKPLSRAALRQAFAKVMSAS